MSIIAKDNTGNRERERERKRENVLIDGGRVHSHIHKKKKARLIQAKPDHTNKHTRRTGKKNWETYQEITINRKKKPGEDVHIHAYPLKHKHERERERVIGGCLLVSRSTTFHT